MEPILTNGTWKPARNPSGSFHAFNPVLKKALSEREYPISGWDDLQDLLDAGQAAASELAQIDPSKIADFLDAYAAEIERNADALVEAAHIETGLPVEPRLRTVELPRTTGQLRQAADAVRDGGWRRPVIDTATGIRSVHNPLGGPVAVFGPNNFPFAFNGVSGGDFTAAIAAGNPVIAKAHPAHPHTSTLLAKTALTALKAIGLPAASVQMFYRTAPELGKRFVSHPSLAAIGFTGGRAGGTALKEAADRVGKPIYLEMSSVNPVFVLAGALRERGEQIASELAGSCTMGGGQFCTKPGLAIIEAGPDGDTFLDALRALIANAIPGTLFTAKGPEEIDSVVSRMKGAGASILAGGGLADDPGYAYLPTLLRASGADFLKNPETLQSEAFGSVCLVVVAEDSQEMVTIASALEGNLTGCLYSATDGSDDPDYARIEPLLRRKVGRLLNDKMPTGVAVSPAMNHGGPFPATGHPHFTAGGIPASLLRFTALHSYDNVRPHRLPAMLRDENPSGSLLRQIDSKWTTANVPL